MDVFKLNLSTQTAKARGQCFVVGHRISKGHDSIPEATVKSLQEAAGVTVEIMVSFKKGAADESLMKKARHFIETCPPPGSAIIIISGDRDFAALIEMAKDAGLPCFVLHSSQTHASLSEPSQLSVGIPRLGKCMKWTDFLTKHMSIPPPHLFNFTLEASKSQQRPIQASIRLQRACLSKEKEVEAADFENFLEQYVEPTSRVQQDDADVFVVTADREGINNIGRFFSSELFIPDKGVVFFRPFVAARSLFDGTKMRKLEGDLSSGLILTSKVPISERTLGQYTRIHLDGYDADCSAERLSDYVVKLTLPSVKTLLSKLLLADGSAIVISEGSLCETPESIHSAIGIEQLSVMELGGGKWLFAVSNEADRMRLERALASVLRFPSATAVATSVTWLHFSAVAVIAPSAASSSSYQEFTVTYQGSGREIEDSKKLVQQRAFEARGSGFLDLEVGPSHGSKTVLLARLRANRPHGHLRPLQSHKIPKEIAVIHFGKMMGSAAVAVGDPQEDGGVTLRGDPMVMVKGVLNAGVATECGVVKGNVFFQKTGYAPQPPRGRPDGPTVVVRGDKEFLAKVSELQAQLNVLDATGFTNGASLIFSDVRSRDRAFEALVGLRLGSSNRHVVSLDHRLFLTVDSDLSDQDVLSFFLSLEGFCGYNKKISPSRRFQVCFETPEYAQDAMKLMKSVQGSDIPIIDVPGGFLRVLYHPSYIHEEFVPTKAFPLKAIKHLLSLLSKKSLAVVIEGSDGHLCVEGPPEAVKKTLSDLARLEENSKGETLKLTLPSSADAVDKCSELKLDIQKMLVAAARKRCRDAIWQQSFLHIFFQVDRVDESPFQFTVFFVCSNCASPEAFKEFVKSLETQLSTLHLTAHQFQFSSTTKEGISLSNARSMMERDDLKGVVLIRKSLQDDFVWVVSADPVAMEKVEQLLLPNAVLPGPGPPGPELFTLQVPFTEADQFFAQDQVSVVFGSTAPLVAKLLRTASLQRELEGLIRSKAAARVEPDSSTAIICRCAPSVEQELRQSLLEFLHRIRCSLVDNPIRLSPVHDHILMDEEPQRELSSRAASPNRPFVARLQVVHDVDCNDPTDAHIVRLGRVGAEHKRIGIAFVDICRLKGVDAMVVPFNGRLTTCSGVAGSVARAAGSAFEKRAGEIFEAEKLKNGGDDICDGTMFELPKGHLAVKKVLGVVLPPWRKNELPTARDYERVAALIKPTLVALKDCKAVALTLFGAGAFKYPADVIAGPFLAAVVACIASGDGPDFVIIPDINAKTMAALELSFDDITRRMEIESEVDRPRPPTAIGAIAPPRVKFLVSSVGCAAGGDFKAELQDIKDDQWLEYDSDASARMLAAYSMVGRNWSF